MHHLLAAFLAWLQVKERNDGGFFLFMAFAFLGPALLGLAVAFGSGYMDKLFALY